MTPTIRSAHPQRSPVRIVAVERAARSLGHAPERGLHGRQREREQAVGARALPLGLRARRTAVCAAARIRPDRAAAQLSTGSQLALSRERCTDGGLRRCLRQEHRRRARPCRHLQRQRRRASCAHALRKGRVLGVAAPAPARASGCRPGRRRPAAAAATCRGSSPRRR